LIFKLKLGDVGQCCSPESKLFCAQIIDRSMLACHYFAHKVFFICRGIHEE
jgi:hypothetical protein